MSRQTSFQGQRAVLRQPSNTQPCQSLRRDQPPRQSIASRPSQPPIQAPCPQFPPRRPLKHQLQAQGIQARRSAQFQGQSHAHAVQRCHHPHSSAGATTQSPANVHPQSQSPVQVAGPMMTFLDAALRLTTERVHSELNNVRFICARVVSKEQKEKEALRKYCETVKRERDVAIQRGRMFEAEVRGAAATERGSGTDSRYKGVKRNRGETESGDDNHPPSASVQRIPTPPSSSSPPVLSSKNSNKNQDSSSLPCIRHSSPSTPSPPPGVARSAMFLRHAATTSQANRTASPVLPSASKLDMTTFDVTVCNSTGERIPNENPAKRRRTSASSQSSDSSNRTLVADPEKGMDRSCLNGLGEADMELESDADAGEGTKNIEGGKSAKRPRLARPSSSSSQKEAVEPEMDIIHVDIMYVPMNGKLFCRACIIHKNQKPTTFSVASFPTDASWETLKQHCVEEHPKACADVAKLSHGEVYELRRRLMRG